MAKRPARGFSPTLSKNSPFGEPRDRQNAHGGVDESMVTGPLAPDSHGRLGIKIDPRSPLVVTPQQTLDITVGGGLEVKTGSPPRIKVKESKSVFVGPDGALHARVMASDVINDSGSGSSLGSTIAGAIQTLANRAATPVPIPNLTDLPDVSGVTGSGSVVKATGGTLNSPIIIGDIRDTTNAHLLGLYETITAVNFVIVWNAQTGQPGIIGTDGTDASINLDVQPKGSGLFTLNSSPIPCDAAFGYHSGSGGTVTQNTSKSTGVTLNKATGQITTNNAALGTLSAVTFTVTCSAVAANDVVALSHVSGGTVGSYLVSCSGVSAGSFGVTIFNTSIGPLSEALVIGYAVVKGQTS